MEAHALVARMTADLDNQPQFPFLCLLVSGGHNLIVLVRGVGQYVQLGTTLDDALGEFGCTSTTSQFNHGIDTFCRVSGNCHAHGFDIRLCHRQAVLIIE
jgi:hypothetical protein